MAATPDDHPDLAAALNNLGNRLESQFERTGRLAFSRVRGMPDGKFYSIPQSFRYDDNAVGRKYLLL